MLMQNEIVSTSGNYTTVITLFNLPTASNSVLLFIPGGTTKFVYNRSFVPLWLEMGTNVAVFNHTANFDNTGMPARFRLSDHRLLMLNSAISELRNRYKTVYVIGHSFGAIEAAAIASTNAASKVVISNGTWLEDKTNNLLFRNACIKRLSPVVPLLILHHLNDKTELCPYYKAKEHMGLYDHITVDGGFPHMGNPGSDPGPHFYTGQEYPVFKEVFNWLNDKTYRNFID